MKDSNSLLALRLTSHRALTIMAPTLLRWGENDKNMPAMEATLIHSAYHESVDVRFGLVHVSLGHPVHLGRSRSHPGYVPNLTGLLAAVLIQSTFLNRHFWPRRSAVESVGTTRRERSQQSFSGGRAIPPRTGSSYVDKCWSCERGRQRGMRGGNYRYELLPWPSRTTAMSFVILCGTCEILAHTYAGPCWAQKRDVVDNGG